MLPRAVDPIRWFIRFPVVHRVVHRLTAKPFIAEDGMEMAACWIDGYMWSRLLSEPAFAEALSQGMADLEAGRTTRYEIRDGELVNVETGEPLA